MKEALLRKIESLPEDAQQRLMEMPLSLLILKLREPALFEADTLRLRLENELRLMQALIEEFQQRSIGTNLPTKQPGKERTLGAFKGQIVMADDFDAPLEDFEEYM